MDSAVEDSISWTRETSVTVRLAELDYQIRNDLDGMLLRRPLQGSLSESEESSKILWGIGNLIKQLWS